MKMALHEALYLPALVFLIRRLREHNRQVRAAGESVGTTLALSLDSLEARMRDYRWAAWFAIPMTALTLFSAYASQAVVREGLAAFWPRAAFVIGFAMVVGAIGTWHYRAHLGPERKRLRELAAAWAGR